MESEAQTGSPGPASRELREMLMPQRILMGGEERRPSGGAAYIRGIIDGMNTEEEDQVTFALKLLADGADELAELRRLVGYLQENCETLRESILVLANEMDKIVESWEGKEAPQEYDFPKS